MSRKQIKRRKKNNIRRNYLVGSATIETEKGIEFQNVERKKEKEEALKVIGE